MVLLKDSEEICHKKQNKKKKIEVVYYNNFLVCIINMLVKVTVTSILRSHEPTFMLNTKPGHSGKSWQLSGKESACSTGDLGSIPGLGRSPGEGNGNPLQYSGLESPKDRGAWWAAVHWTAKSWHNRTHMYTERATYSCWSHDGIHNWVNLLFFSAIKKKSKHIFVYQKQFWRSFSTAWSKRKPSP